MTEPLPVEALHREIDAQVRPLEVLHGDRLVCARGCSDCCVDDIGVFVVEAELIRFRHASLLEEGEPHAPGACAFLDAAGACRIYAERPYVCRTQGLPLRWLDEAPLDEGPEPQWIERRDICKLNEPGLSLLELEPEACWTLGPTEAKLQALQAAAGLALERGRLRDLFRRPNGTEANQQRGKCVSLTREQAWEHLCSWTDTAPLRNHARAVEVVMRAAAIKYGDGEVDVQEWGIAGILHDADYEKWPEDHPKRTVAWLREQGEEALAHAVSAHFTKWGMSYESQLDRALLACDELTGFVVACCLVRPEGVATLTPKSVKKKLKDKRFAAKVDRGEVSVGVEMLGVDLGEHIEMVVAALKPHADELGIGGKGK